MSFSLHLQPSRLVIYNHKTHTFCAIDSSLTCHRIDSYHQGGLENFEDPEQWNSELDTQSPSHTQLDHFLFDKSHLDHSSPNPSQRSNSEWDIQENIHRNQNVNQDANQNQDANENQNVNQNANQNIHQFYNKTSQNANQNANPLDAQDAGIALSNSLNPSRRSSNSLHSSSIHSSKRAIEFYRNATGFSLKETDWRSVDFTHLSHLLHQGVAIHDIEAIFGFRKLFSGIYVCISIHAPVVTQFLGKHTIRMNQRLGWVCVFRPKDVHVEKEARYLRLLETATSQYGQFYHVESNENGVIEWDLTRTVQEQLSNQDKCNNCNKCDDSCGRLCDKSDNTNCNHCNMSTNATLREPSKMRSNSKNVDQTADQNVDQNVDGENQDNGMHFTNDSMIHKINNCNKEFFWNHFASSCLIEAGLFEFVTPMILGFVSGFKRVSQKSKSLDFWLVSRLSCNRVGTRFYSRGVDQKGNVSNFVETEQTVMIGSEITSFLQIRGSIPVFWNQTPDLKYEPRIRFYNTHASKAYQCHMEKHADRYGNLVCVSLINLKGVELSLAQAFEKEHAVHKSSRVRLISWDFHKECAGMRYSNIKKLIAMMQNELTNFGYFAYDTEKKHVFSTQKGVIRSNCKDCLDRTNVVMSVIAKVTLKHILISKGILKPNQTINKTLPHVSQQFKLLWADNGDALSQMYAGTGALKSDFTRTGKRTIRGALQDLLNSITRYYLNNFQDGTKQDAITLLLGKYELTASSDPLKLDPFVHILTKTIWSVFFGSLVYFLYALVNLLLGPRDQILSFITSFLVFSLITMILKLNGESFVNKPKLVYPQDSIVTRPIETSMNEKNNEESKKTK